MRQPILNFTLLIINLHAVRQGVKRVGRFCLQTLSPQLHVAACIVPKRVVLRRRQLVIQILRITPIDVLYASVKAGFQRPEHTRRISGRYACYGVSICYVCRAQLCIKCIGLRVVGSSLVILAAAGKHRSSHQPGNCRQQYSYPFHILIIFQPADVRYVIRAQQPLPPVCLLPPHCLRHRPLRDPCLLCSQRTLSRPDYAQ